MVTALLAGLFAACLIALLQLLALVVWPSSVGHGVTETPT